MNAPARFAIEASAWANLIDVLAPGADDVVAIFNSYFDESFDDHRLCVGGYVFRNLKGKELDAKWRRMLFRFKELPYFRMSACNSGEYPFDRLTEEECIACQTEAIALVSEHAAFGYAVSIDQDAFRGAEMHLKTPYELCVWMCLLAVHEWMERTSAIGDAAYFFEAGHQHQALANALMDRIFRVEGLRQFYRYSAHAFVDKAKVRPVQTADILAWQAFKQWKRYNNKQSGMRADLRALLKKPETRVIDVEKSELDFLLGKIKEAFGDPANAGRYIYGKWRDD